MNAGMCTRSGRFSQRQRAVSEVSTRPPSSACPTSQLSVSGACTMSASVSIRYFGANFSSAAAMPCFTAQSLPVQRGGNIAFGLPEFTEEQVREAAGIANLDTDILDFPRRYDTIVGERGITLSGGQKQRTAIARAVIRDPRILILDDALSSVDTQTEERILSRLKDIMAGRTTILISHRTSTVRDADQIVVLIAGKIVERGTHDELLAAGGYYADLYQKQLLEEELERA